MVHCSGMQRRALSLSSSRDCLFLSSLALLLACGGAPAKPAAVDLGQELPADAAVEAGGHIAQAGEKVVYDHPPKRPKPKAQEFRGHGRNKGRQEPASSGQHDTPPPEPQNDTPPAQQEEAEAAAAPDATTPTTPDTPDDVAAPPSDAKMTRTGLYTKVLKPGTGLLHPGPTSKVLVHYTGWTTNGRLFDSSVVRGQPLQLPLNGVIPGWSEGVQLMVQGEKRRLWIPENLAYKGREGAPKGMLVFDIELIDIQ